MRKNNCGKTKAHAADKAPAADKIEQLYKQARQAISRDEFYMERLNDLLQLEISQISIARKSWPRVVSTARLYQHPLNLEDMIALRTDVLNKQIGEAAVNQISINAEHYTTVHYNTNIDAASTLFSLAEPRIHPSAASDSGCPSSENSSSASPASTDDGEWPNPHSPSQTP
jgi:hypothetical protein